MQATLAQQLTIFSFGAATFMFTLVGVIAFVSMLRLMRLERLANMPMTVAPQPAVVKREQPQTNVDTKPKPPLRTQTTPKIDIQIDPVEEPVAESRYKPRSVSRAG